MFQRIKLSESANTDMPANMCCEEHRRQLMKFADLSQLLPNIDMTNLAFHFARHCQNNKKAARVARRLTAITQRSTANDEKGASPFHVVDRLLTAPTGLYGPEWTSRPFHDMCSRDELVQSLERYRRASILHDYNVAPYAFDIQLKQRSLSFLSKQQVHARLMGMRNITLKETKINRVHKGFLMHVQAIVDPLITTRSIQTIVEDSHKNIIRLSIYNWYTILADQSKEHIHSRIRRERSFLIGQPFVKMGADNMLILRVDNPRLELWCTDYERELDQMTAEKLRDLGNKCFHNNDVYGAIEYYSLGLAKRPTDTRILSNRAECYLQVQLPHLALADCERILDICTTNPTEENTDMTLKWKVHYRKMRALIGVQQFDQAKLSINPLLACTQDSSPYNEILDRFRRILDCDIPRLQNEVDGNYSMFEVIASHKKGPDDFLAEFERANVTEFRQCDKQERGFGMFALHALQPGTLLLVERPVAYVPARTNDSLIDDPSRLITFSLTQKPENRSLDEGSTHGGKYLRQTSLELIQQLETRLLIDHKHFLEKLAHLMPLRQRLLRSSSDEEDSCRLPYRVLMEIFERNVIGNGLWAKLARFNHSCLPNCFYMIVNQVCFLSVLQPIEPGEELTICYLPTVYTSYVERTLHMREYYVDECDCRLCEYDRSVGQAELQQLYRQFDEAEEDDERRRQLFKHLIHRYADSRPLGFVAQMSGLKRYVSTSIFLQQVKHGYLPHPYILKYLLAHSSKASQLADVVKRLQQELAYCNWKTDVPFEQDQSFKSLARALISVLPE